MQSKPIALDKLVDVIRESFYKRGNYVPSVLSRRYNAFIYLDQTQALHPLHIHAGEEVPETYPFGVQDLYPGN